MTRTRRGGAASWRAAAAAAACAVAGAAGAACPPSAADGTPVGKGDLVLAWRSADGKPGRLPLARHVVLDVQLCDKGGASNALLKKVDATMPEHRHGMNYRPSITPLGGGRFRVAGMMFHMAGHWELSFEVQAGGDTVRLTHDMRID